MTYIPDIPDMPCPIMPIRCHTKFHHENKNTQELQIRLPCRCIGEAGSSFSAEGPQGVRSNGVSGLIMEGTSERNVL